MTVFNPNAMLRAQFPSLDARTGLQRWLERTTLAEIRGSKVTVLVVRHRHEVTADERLVSGLHDIDQDLRTTSAPPVSSEIIAFAKWTHPVIVDEDHVQQQRSWPEGTDMAVLEEWIRITEEAQEAAIGQVPCFRE
jgi:hypothetical protein